MANPSRTPWSPLAGCTRGVSKAASRDAGLFLFPGTPQVFLSRLNQQSHCCKIDPDPNPFVSGRTIYKNAGICKIITVSMC